MVHGGVLVFMVFMVLREEFVSNVPCMCVCVLDPDVIYSLS